MERHHNNIIVKVCWHCCQWVWLNIEKFDAAANICIVAILILVGV